MEISPKLKRKAQKVLENKGDMALTNLDAVLELQDKIDELKNELVDAIVTIPEVEIPETIIPSEITISNLPEVQKIEAINLPEIQKVQVINPPKEKDDTEVKNLLKELVAEVKKKEEYEYDIEIDPTLKEQLKGDKGKDGTEIKAKEIVDKLESLEDDDRLDISAIRGVDATIEQIAKSVVKEKIKDIKKVYVGGGNSSSSGGIAESFETVSKNLDASNATLNYTGDNLTSIVYANGITKTLNYTGDNLTSVVLSGSTPSGITLTKTLSYTGVNLTGVSYS